MIRLIGPGGAGKSTIGALLADRLGMPFVDLDRHFASRVGDISEYIGRHGYEATRGRMWKRTVRCSAERPAQTLSRCLRAS